MKNKIIIFICLLLFSCSSNNELSRKIWNKDKEKIKVKKDVEYISFKTKKETLSKEINLSLEINISKSNLQYPNQLKNHDGIIDYDNQFNELKKVNFKKISNPMFLKKELIFGEDYLILFDGDGTLIRLDKNFNEVWKKNFYSKLEKKNNPFLFFAQKNNILVIADNISKLYAINISTGELIWSKNHSSAFNSEIKISGDNFYVSDLNNLIMCISIKTGEQRWSFQSEYKFIKTLNKTSIVLDNNTVYFLNSVGDLTALDIRKGFLKWQISNQNNTLFNKYFLNQNSKVVMYDDSIFFSNNNELYSIDKTNGFLKWKKKVQTVLSPIIADKYLFIVTSNNFFVILDKSTGKILRSNFILKDFNPKKIKNIYPNGFVASIKKIYLSMNNGELLTIDIKNGITSNRVKVSNKSISKPQIYNKDLFILKEDELLIYH